MSIYSPLSKTCKPKLLGKVDGFVPFTTMKRRITLVRMEGALKIQADIYGLRSANICLYEVLLLHTAKHVKPDIIPGKLRSQGCGEKIVLATKTALRRHESAANVRETHPYVAIHHIFF